MASLKDKVILITGASSGIGAGIAEHLSRFNPKLVLTGRNKDRLETTSSACQELGLAKDRILTVVCDVNKDEDLRHLVEKTIQTFGSLYGLVNNAGIAKDFVNVEESNMDDFDEMIRTNLRAPYYLSKLCIPELKKSKGRVVNISSIHSKIASHRCPAYSLAKAGLDVFTHILASELGPSGVCVNSVNPGFIWTSILETLGFTPEQKSEMADSHLSRTPLNRLGTTEDVAKAVTFFLCDESSFVTGETLVVDGGRINPVI